VLNNQFTDTISESLIPLTGGRIHQTADSEMATPLRASPMPATVEGGATVKPRDMIAIRVKTSGKTKATMEDQSERIINLPVGTEGFLVRNKGNDALCQFISPKTAKLCMCMMIFVVSVRCIPLTQLHRHSTKAHPRDRQTRFRISHHPPKDRASPTVQPDCITAKR
jgi:hypothetical protein